MRLTLAPLTNFDIGVVVAALVAFAAYRARGLDGSGALAAFFVGTATFGGLDLAGASILFAFFVSSIALSRAGRGLKRERLRDIGKTGARDAAQVIANGGVAAICALLVLRGDPHYAVAFAGAFAAATADTWGTELGALFGGTPRSILTWRPIAIGLSGGVTAVGTIAECAGALFIGAVAFGFAIPFWPVVAGGLAGALVDSLLGASLQSLRWCPQCRRPCEVEPHICGANTTPLRGVSWIGNDAVNLAATVCGAAVAFALAR